MNRVRAVAGHDAHTSSAIEGWSACSVPPGSIAGPEALESAGVRWIASAVAKPAAAMLRDAKEWSLDAPARKFDAEEWWFRARFPRGERADEVALCFDGLATLADVWLNGAPLLTSENMFLAHERAVGPLLADENELVLRVRSLDAALGARRPRPRWRVPMLEQQQLRWMRTTLLGRTPGWSPPAAVVGPWRAVRLERRAAFAVEDVVVRPVVTGVGGRLEVACTLRPLRPHARVTRVEVVLDRKCSEHRVALTLDGTRAIGALELPRVDKWWPHTHGEPALYDLRLLVQGEFPGATSTIELGSVGFRDVVASGDFALSVNGVPIFCRGACWTPLDPVTLSADRAAVTTALTQAQRAGMNMLRVGGTMVYESDDFYDLADELGILLWHDFMFANMDYPEDDAPFVAGVEAEAKQFLSRMQGRPSVAVLCGNSEGEQQAAMWGTPRERWSPRLFHEVLPRVCAESLPGVPYWPSSAHGGAFPHEATVGTTSYYGVGAYLRPLTDARHSAVKFATECLAFANVPAAERLPGGPSARVHHPAWKARTPRDLGAGWDFDDVRDHYVQDLFRVDPMRLRYGDHDRYLALGRVVTGEVMASAMGEWRRKRSVCQGAMIWFLRDFWPSAGWGVVDSSGRPKAAYHYLRRALQPVSVHLSDEGGSGVFAHVTNERGARMKGELEVTLFKAGEVTVASAKRAVELAAHEVAEIAVGSMFETFLDFTYSYRFGPPSHDLIVATLHVQEASPGSHFGAPRGFYFPLGLPGAKGGDLGVSATARARGDGDFDVTFKTRAFAQSLSFELEGFAPDDEFFHLAPGAERTVIFRRDGGSALRGYVHALNSDLPVKIVLEAST